MRPVVLAADLDVVEDPLELGRELILPAGIRQVERHSVALVDGGEVLLRVGDVRAALEVGLGLHVHTAEADVEASSLGQHGAPDKTTRYGVALCALVGAGGESGVVSEGTILPPDVVVGDGMHDTDTTAWLVDVCFGLIEVLLAGRAVGRGETEGHGVVTGADEVILVEAVLQVDVLEGDLVVREGSISTEVPVVTVVRLEADTHIADTDPIVHRAILRLGSFILRVGRSVEEGTTRDLDLDFLLCICRSQGRERSDCDEKTMLDIHVLVTSCLG